MRIGYYSGDVKMIKEDCMALRPTCFPAVPRVYNKIYDMIQAKFAELYGVRKYLANKAINTKLFYLKRDGTINAAFYDKVVCSKFR